MTADLALHIVLEVAATLVMAVKSLILPGVFFMALAFLLKRADVLRSAKAAREDINANLGLLAFNVTVIGPINMILTAAVISLASFLSPYIVLKPVWEALPELLVLFAAVFCGDFIGYCRHRLEHTALLWPAHAVHHSDSHMNWLTLERFHPINRWTTLLFDGLLLSLLGFPAWALVASNLFRHYYGFFIHADVPWTYGRLSAVFVSPAMHQWHHARDITGSGSNFATVFSVFDRAFGTYHVPGPCNVPLGIHEDMGQGTTGLLVAPFRLWGRQLADWYHLRGAKSEAEAKP
jgi:sterol desaturase/sphingolipid hydroxylase (fatty acid hydroxylase superfamily)